MIWVDFYWIIRIIPKCFLFVCSFFLNPVPNKMILNMCYFDSDKVVRTTEDVLTTFILPRKTRE